MANDKMSTITLPIKTGNQTQNKTFDVGGSGDTKTFVGTIAEWNALTTEQQNAYDCRVLTDDELPVVEVIDNLNSDSSTNALSAKQGKVLKGLVDTTQAQVSNSGDAYDPTRPYKVGELCIYNNVLYRCTTACSAGSWATNQSCFTVDTLVNLVSDNSNSMIITDTTSSDPKAVIASHWDEIPTSYHQQLICIVTAVYTYYAIVGKYNPHYSAVKLYGYGENDTSYKIVVGQRYNDVWKWRSLKFGGRETITALQSNNGTWVATEDGFITFNTNESVSGVVYIYLYEGETIVGSIALTNGTGGLNHMTTVPVAKGNTYKMIYGGTTRIGVNFRPLYS